MMLRFFFRKKVLLLLSLVVFAGLISQAQVITEPVFPKAAQAVRIVYDATQGSSGLREAEKVYMHAGIITTGFDGTGWENVVGNWGQDDGVGQMTKVEGEEDKWEITITPQEYFSPGDKRIYRIGMVFRNADGSREGKSPSNSDIFVNVDEEGLQIRLFEPISSSFFVEPDESVRVRAVFSESANLTVRVNNEITQTLDQVTEFDEIFVITEAGATNIRLTAQANGQTQSVAFSAIIPSETIVQEKPAQLLKDGVNYLPDNEIGLVLTAPGKNSVYLLGEFNEWQILNEYQMFKTPDGNQFWITMSVEPNVETAYQFLVDGELRIADPYAEKVLDPWNDQWINEVHEIYPNLKPYPFEQTSGIVSVFEYGQEEYAWQVTNFQKPAKEKLIVYELLVRDFLGRHDFKTLTDTLPYLKNLGVNAIELMPIMEFEGNSSWGYNPSFFFAVDKYYGPKNDLKAFIDACHQHGIAVILDMVLNHAFGQNPMVQMYWDSENARPAENSPWFNPIPKHPFNVGYDFNHESDFTKKFTDDVNDFWLREFKFDGYRFDLSKGFTQVNSGDNVGLWSQYDQSRIDILSRMADAIWENHPDAYVILEHFAANDEEIVLSRKGMMLWGNMHGAYQNAIQGRSSNLNGASHKQRGWEDPHLVSYMESHDEERMVWAAKRNGRAFEDYNIREEETALQRMKLNAVFLFPIPGPKMLWQFGELGYDFELNNDRLGRKPIRWDYLDQPLRFELMNVYRELFNLRDRHDIFHTEDFSTSQLGGLQKILRLTGEQGNVIIVGNFDVESRIMTPNFNQAGKWYDYFSNSDFEVSDTGMKFVMKPGAFHIFSDFHLGEAMENLAPYPLAQDFITNTENLSNAWKLYPNPGNGQITIENLNVSSPREMRIKDISGREVIKKRIENGKIQANIESLPNGLYVILIEGEQEAIQLKYLKK